MIIALDARPLVTRNIRGPEQRARNIVREWAANAPHHRFILLIERGIDNRSDFDRSFLDQLPGNFITHLTLLGNYSLAKLPWRRAIPINVGHDWDVFHSFSPGVPHSLGTPMVNTIHDLSCELDPDVRATAEGARERWIVRRSLRRVRCAVAVSKQTRHDLLSLYRIQPWQVKVIYNGINPVFVPEPDQQLRAQLHNQYGISQRYILLVGSDIPRRNYQRVWEAMMIVWKTHPRLRLLLAGRGKWTNAPIYRQAAADGLLDRVIFLDSPSDQMLAQLYRDAMLTCCGSSFEGFGLSVLEAMACGCPVACSEIRSLREVADEAVVYFTHDDPESIAGTLLELIEDPEYRRQLRLAGLQRADHFKWSTAAQHLLEVLETVAKTGSAPSDPQPVAAYDEGL
ncbi:MAG TPA: glycosyltransferase family 1 protein [Phycisphaerae bacterium]|nr:glycosyltransferase family 1 protein [Phycisphaerae bacterium]